MKTRKKNQPDVSNMTPVEPNANNEAMDEALFEQLKRAKKKKRRKRLLIILIVLVVLIAAAVIGIQMLQKKVRTQFAASGEEVLSAQAERGSISTVVSGSGMLVNVDTETVSVPAGVTVTDVLVKYGNTVAVGDMLATVDMTSVRSAMSSLQENIDSLDDQIADAKGDSVSSSITAGVSGRVKILHAAEGDSVEDVMISNGSLAVLSLDGYMAVDIESDRLQEGDSVTVVLSDGSTVTGTVDRVIGTKVTVLVSDNGPEADETVTVKTTDGTVLGTGSLYIHNSLAITGYAGTISKVKVSLNQTVKASTTVFTLSDTSTNAAYNALLRERSELEETLLELLTIQRNGCIVAPISGSIYSVSDLDDADFTTATDILTISPDLSVQVTISVDESDILSMELGQKADVTVSSIGDEVLEGIVTEIDKTYSNSSYTAVVTLDKVEGMISGMTASVDIRIEGVDDAILIPVDALHQTSSSYYVYTGYDEETKEYTSQTEVVPGLSNSSYVEIKSGLNEGDTVYYTESQDFSDIFASFGGSMPGGFGGDSSGSGMPGGFGGGSGGGMPGGFGGGSDSGNGGGRPSGMPSGFGG